MPSHRIPELAECHFDTPPVPKPLYVCWHPDSDDSFDVSGYGQTCSEAYRNMLDDLFESLCNGFETDQEADEFLKEIKRQQAQVS